MKPCVVYYDETLDDLSGLGWAVWDPQANTTWRYFALSNVLNMLHETGASYIILSDRLSRHEAITALTESRVP